MATHWPSVETVMWSTVWWRTTTRSWWSCLWGSGPSPATPLSCTRKGQTTASLRCVQTHYVAASSDLNLCPPHLKSRIRKQTSPFLWAHSVCVQGLKGSKGHLKAPFTRLTMGMWLAGRKKTNASYFSTEGKQTGVLHTFLFSPSGGALCIPDKEAFKFQAAI